jgi:2-polyprenyl-3-methyl-5-hydroxy-6-metoxy-1,4-benzoquinol methylase
VSFDVLLLLEVVEHVDDAAFATRWPTCAQRAAVSTINRTLRSYQPRSSAPKRSSVLPGARTDGRTVRPEELEQAVAACGLAQGAAHGLPAAVHRA